MFATAIPGLAPLLRDELESAPGVEPSDVGNDRKSDVVLFTTKDPAGGRVQDLRLAEDVFVEVGRTRRSEGDRPAWIARRIWRPERVYRALTARSQLGRTPRQRPTFRVIARVLQERSFLRTELRRELTAAIKRQQPGWAVADPAEIEVWVTEYRPGSLIAGLRLTGVATRQHDGRAIERQGALRPTVAAAMVRLAGPPNGTLVDPCCGSGTILAEALDVGWRARGIDIHHNAVSAATLNVPNAQITQGDARNLDLGPGEAGAVVSNLPFGKQFKVPGDPDTWLRAVLAEIVRITSSGSRVVLLAPRIPQAVTPREFQLSERDPIQLLGEKTTIWTYDRP